MREIRDIPFRFSRSFAYAYEGHDIIRYVAGQTADVSIGCATSATQAGCGEVVKFKPAKKEEVVEKATENKRWNNPATENKGRK